MSNTSNDHKSKDTNNNTRLNIDNEDEKIYKWKFIPMNYLLQTFYAW